MHNLASVIAAGFVAVYLKSADSEAQQQAIVANLTNIFETVYGYGLKHAQLDFASRLAGEISKNPKISSKELLALVSSLSDSFIGRA